MGGTERTPDGGGWVAIGPMEALCREDAPTAQAARDRYAPHEIDLEPIQPGSRLALRRCAACGRVIAEV